jgi:hypothetical protein
MAERNDIEFRKVGERLYGKKMLESNQFSKSYYHGT